MQCRKALVIAVLALVVFASSSAQSLQGELAIDERQGTSGVGPWTTVLKQFPNGVFRALAENRPAASGTSAGGGQLPASGGAAEVNSVSANAVSGIPPAPICTASQSGLAIRPRQRVRSF